MVNIFYLLLLFMKKLLNLPSVRDGKKGKAYILTTPLSSVMFTRKCAECGKEFEKNSNNQKYCSKRCKQRRDDHYRHVMWVMTNSPRLEKRRKECKEWRRKAAERGACTRCGAMLPDEWRGVRRICPTCLEYNSSNKF